MIMIRKTNCSLLQSIFCYRSIKKIKNKNENEKKQDTKKAKKIVSQVDSLHGIG